MSDMSESGSAPVDKSNKGPSDAQLGDATQADTRARKPKIGDSRPAPDRTESTNESRASHGASAPDGEQESTQAGAEGSNPNRRRRRRRKRPATQDNQNQSQADGQDSARSQGQGRNSGENR